MADISLDDLIKAKTQTMDNNADAQNWQVMTKKEEIEQVTKQTELISPEYDRAGIREIYLLVKMPGRIKKLFSKRKYRFDEFTDFCTIWHKCSKKYSGVFR